MLYDINKIYTFLAIVKERSFSKASKVLGISQPAVTLQIKRLEDALQTTLIIRKKNGILLTKDGEKFYQLCLKLDDTVSKFIKETVSLKDEEMLLSVGTTASIGEIIFPYMLDKLADVTHSNLEIRIVDYGDFAKSLLTKKCDFAVTADKLDNSLFYTKELFDLEYVLVSNKPKNQIDMNELLSIKFIKDRSKSFLEYYFENYGILYSDFKAKYYLNGPMSIKIALLNNSKEDYYAFLPKFFVEEEVKENKLFIIPIKNLQLSLKNSFKLTRKLYAIALNENKALVDKIAGIKFTY